MWTDFEWETTFNCRLDEYFPSLNLVFALGTTINDTLMHSIDCAHFMRSLKFSICAHFSDVSQISAHS